MAIIFQFSLIIYLLCFRCLLGLTKRPCRPFAVSSVKSIPAPFSLPAPRSAKTSRWALILADYVGIREAVLNSPRLMAQTNLQPFELNQRPVVRLMDGL